MKPDFNIMSELLAYLQGTPDNEAWGIYLDRRDPNAKQYPAPLNEGHRGNGRSIRYAKLMAIVALH